MSTNPERQAFIDFLEQHPLTWDRLLHVLPDGIAFVDEGGIVRHANPLFLALAGYELDELVGRSVEVLLPERYRDAHVGLRRNFASASRVRTMGRRLNLTLRRHDGSELAVDIALAPIVLGGQPWIIVLMRDDSADRATARARDEIEQRFRLAFEDNMAPMAFTDLDDRCLAVNDAFCEMLGLGRDELLGRDSSTFTHPADVGITESVHRQLVSGEVDRVRYVKRYVQRGGRVVVVEVAKSTARDEQGTPLYYVSSERDVTEERALTDQLAHRALHDPLTGLANRALFDDRLTHAFERVDRHGGYGAVMLIDLDDFKLINDTRGHVAGDELLAATAQRMESLTRTSDTLCRFGGDEFLYLAEGLSSPEEIEPVAARILDGLGAPFTIGGAVVEQRASIGIVVFDRDRLDRTSLVRDADAALYEAKRSGKGRAAVFAPDARGATSGHVDLGADLRHAMARGEIAVQYQPIVDLATLVVVGFEALTRWRHPVHGLVSADVVSTLAHQTGLSEELGAFVLREALREVRAWSDVGDHAYVSINFSARQCGAPGFEEMIERELAASAVAPERLVIEVTDGSASLDDAPGAAMERLASRGITFAIGNFGVGFSSLRHLTIVRPRTIKIDPWFMGASRDELAVHALIEAVVALGRQLAITVLVQGVATRAQYARLRELGCDLGQGSLFSPAVDAAAVPTFFGRAITLLDPVG